MSDVEIVARLYEAMAARDVETLFSLVHPDCVTTQDDRLPWGGRYVGHDGFAQRGLALTSAVESTVTTAAIFEADGEVIQMGRTAGRVVASGVPFDIAEVHRWTMRDGLAVAAHFAIDTTAMLAALAADGAGSGEA